MESKSLFFKKLTLSVWVVLVFFLAIYIFPWSSISWGSLRFASDGVVTVTGSATKQVKNQIARFSAGVSVVSDNREKAVSEVNTKMEEIVKAVKIFGVNASDIQTQNASIYQMQESYYEDGRQKSRPGQWSVSNNVEIILREVDRAADLAEILSKSGANNVYGPTFTMDLVDSFEEDLAQQAIEGARKKAEAMVKAAGASLGKVVSVSEGVSSGPIFPVYGRAMGGGGGEAVVEPGGSTVTKSVTITFELK